MKVEGFLFLVMLIILSLEVQELKAVVRPLQLLGESRQKTALFSEQGSWKVDQQRQMCVGGGEKKEGRML